MPGVRKNTNRVRHANKPRIHTANNGFSNAESSHAQQQEPMNQMVNDKVQCVMADLGLLPLGSNQSQSHGPNRNQVETGRMQEGARSDISIEAESSTSSTNVAIEKGSNIQFIYETGQPSVNGRQHSHKPIGSNAPPVPSTGALALGHRPSGQRHDTNYLYMQSSIRLGPGNADQYQQAMDFSQASIVANTDDPTMPWEDPMLSMDDFMSGAETPTNNPTQAVQPQDLSAFQTPGVHPSPQRTIDPQNLALATPGTNSHAPNGEVGAASQPSYPNAMGPTHHCHSDRVRLTPPYCPLHGVGLGTWEFGGVSIRAYGCSCTQDQVMAMMRSYVAGQGHGP